VCNRPSGLSTRGAGRLIEVLRSIGLSCRYGSRTVLASVDLSLRDGEVVGLIGANGAGKTTLLRTLLGFVRPDSGRVEWRGGRGFFPPATVGWFGGAHTLPPKVRARTWTRLVSADFSGATPGDRRLIAALSRGSRQFLGLSAVLARTDLLTFFLDEPWEGLDPDAARWLTEALDRRRQAGAASLVSSHRLHDLAGLCDRYAFLLDGRVVMRSASEISSRPLRGEDLLQEFDRIRKVWPGAGN
jgi:ABC-type multidrug transport system ATPase subunit